jgi:hypothetical protein
MIDEMKAEIRSRMGGFVGYPTAAEGLTASDSVSHNRGCAILPEAEGTIKEMWRKTKDTGAEVVAPVMVRNGRITVGARKEGEPDSIDVSEAFDSVPTDLADRIGLLHTHPTGGWNSVMSHTDLYFHAVTSRDRHPKYDMGYVVTEVGGEVSVFGVENNEDAKRQDFDRAMVEMEKGLSTAEQAFIADNLDQAKKGVFSMWNSLSPLVTPCREKVGEL